jgi:hypothetical protein
VAMMWPRAYFGSVVVFRESGKRRKMSKSIGKLSGDRNDDLVRITCNNTVSIYALLSCDCEKLKSF